MKKNIVKSIEIMLVWVVDIMLETLLPKVLGLLFNDNLKKCKSISM